MRYIIYERYIPGRYVEIYDWRTRKPVERAVFDLGAKPVVVGCMTGDEALEPEPLPSEQKHETSTKDKLRDAIRKRKRPMSIAELSNATDIKKATIKRTMDRNPDMFVRATKHKHRGKVQQNMYSLVEQHSKQPHA